MEVRATMEEDRMSDFLRGLSVLGYVRDHLNSPRGLCIRLVYRNGDFMILGLLNTEFSAIFNYRGDVVYNIGSELLLPGGRHERRGRVRDMLYRFFDYRLE